MKRYVIVLLTLISICSCQNDRVQISNIEYSIVDYSLNDEFNNRLDEGHLKAHEIIKGSNFHFKFLDTDTLLIAPKLGMKYFGDSIFTYSISGDKIKLKGRNGNMEILLNGKRTNEFIDVYFENDIFKRIGLLQKRVKFKNNAKKLQGLYSMARCEVGSKYVNDIKLGYRILDSAGLVVFNFKEDSLFMSPKFGMKFYGDSVFYYKIMDQKLILDSKGGRFEMPFEGADISRGIRLYPKDGNFDYLWLVKKTSGIIPLKENEVFEIKKKSNLKLQGNYSMGDYTLGDKFSNNSKEGHAEVQRKYWPFNKPVFNFLNDSIVQVNSNFKDIFFGDTILHYDIGAEFIRFRNKKYKNEMHYVINRGGLLRLSLNNDEIKIITISPTKTNK